MNQKIIPILFIIGIMICITPAFAISLEQVVGETKELQSLQNKKGFASKCKAFFYSLKVLHDINKYKKENSNIQIKEPHSLNNEYSLEYKKELSDFKNNIHLNIGNVTQNIKSESVNNKNKNSTNTNNNKANTTKTLVDNQDTKSNNIPSYCFDDLRIIGNPEYSVFSTITMDLKNNIVQIIDDDNSLQYVQVIDINDNEVTLKNSNDQIFKCNISSFTCICTGICLHGISLSDIKTKQSLYKQNHVLDIASKNGSDAIYIMSLIVGIIFGLIMIITGALMILKWNIVKQTESIYKDTKNLWDTNNGILTKANADVRNQQLFQWNHAVNKILFSTSSAIISSIAAGLIGMTSLIGAPSGVLMIVGGIIMSVGLTILITSIVYLIKCIFTYENDEVYLRNMQRENDHQNVWNTDPTVY